MIERVKELLKGPDALQPWTLPAMPAPLVDLLPWRAWDEAGEFYVNAASCGFVLELPPFAGIDEGTLDALAGNAGRFGARALGGAGHPLDEPTLRGGDQGLGAT